MLAFVFGPPRGAVHKSVSRCRHQGDASGTQTTARGKPRTPGDNPVAAPEHRVATRWLVAALEHRVITRWLVCSTGQTTGLIIRCSRRRCVTEHRGGNPVVDRSTGQTTGLVIRCSLWRCVTEHRVATRWLVCSTGQTTGLIIRCSL